jgi:hypothetical protein
VRRVRSADRTTPRVVQGGDGFRNGHDQPVGNESLSTAWRGSYSRIEHIQKACSLDGLPLVLSRPYSFRGRPCWPFRCLDGVSPADGAACGIRSQATFCPSVVFVRLNHEGLPHPGGVIVRMVSIGSQLDHPAIARKGRSPSNPTPPQSLKSWTLSAVAKSKLPATCCLWSTTNCDSSPHDVWLGRVRAKRSRPQRLFTKHIYASSGPRRVSLGTAAATSSPLPLRRCGGY